MGYPNTTVKPLSNDVQATTTITINEGMQIATIQFANAADTLGTIVLSPVQPNAKNIEYEVGKQLLSIEEIKFQAAFGLSAGEVKCKGSATDQDGQNPVGFNKQIASWAK